ncbi:MAG TPA: peptidoglycan-binding domain-containing protein [Chthoniobacterales bacterium]
MIWPAGPHLFIADDLIWVFTPLTTSGVHSPSWNNIAWGVELVGEYDDEPFNPGVRENAVDALATLHLWRGISPDTLRFHKEDPNTTHTHCPGRNVNKADLIARIHARMASGNGGEHQPQDDYLEIGAGGGGAEPGVPALTHPPLAGNAELQLAAGGKRRPFVRGRDHGEALGVIQDALDRVLPPEDRIQAGGNRGTFGPKTEAAVIRFQQSVEIEADGKVGREMLLALDAALSRIDGSAPRPEPDGPAGSLDPILQIAAGSEIARYRWNERGRAPLAYIKGMALVYGRVYCKFKAGDPAAVEMAKAAASTAARDVLAHYRAQFAALGMDNSVSGVDTLRHLFVLLMGLGMRESSGKHCMGLYAPDGNTTGETAEAGLFQTSYNARTASPLLPGIFAHYRANPSGFLEVFSQGVSCPATDAANYGSGDGKEFQRLSKQCPAFAAEFAALAMRHRRNHWAPIKDHKREAEVRPEADEMLQQVEAEADRSQLGPVLV